jgi:chaperonin cofactor prefoldin
MSQRPAVTDTEMARALLTDGERRALDPESDMDQNTRSTHLSRVKNKIDLLAEDARLLREHRPELYERAHEAVCEEEIDERVERLEEQVEELQKQLHDA